MSIFLLLHVHGDVDSELLAHCFSGHEHTGYIPVTMAEKRSCVIDARSGVHHACPRAPSILSSLSLSPGFGPQGGRGAVGRSARELAYHLILQIGQAMESCKCGGHQQECQAG